MQAREFGASAHADSSVRGNPGPGSFKSKKPTAVIATPDLDLWAQLGPMLESTVAMRHADSLASAAAMLKPGTRTILVADLRGLSPEDFAAISGSPHNPVVIAIRDGASAGMVDQLMLEGSIHALVDAPVEQAAIMRAVNDAARISSTADALSAVTAPSSGSSGGEEKSGKPMGLIIGAVVGVLALAGAGWYFTKGSSQPAESAEATESEAAAPAAGAAPAAKGAQPVASLDEVLEKARLAMDERRYIEPAKNNALEHFRQVLVLDPKNAEATEGLKRLGGLLIARARTALDERRFDNALAELEAARSIDPSDQSLLEAAQKDALLPPAQIAQLSKDLDSKRRSATISRLVAGAEARLSSGRLVTPSGDSAKESIASLKEAGASNELVNRLNNDLN